MRGQRDPAPPRPPPRRARARGAVAAVLLALGRARGAFVVTHGPPSLVGLELVAAEQAFSPVEFDVSGRVVVTRREAWSYDAGCPPAYVGNGSLAGAIVVHLDANWALCSHEQHARAAGARGALLWAHFPLAFTRHFDQVPGQARHFWAAGDARWLESPPALHLAQPAALPLVDALLRADARERADGGGGGGAARAAAVRARVTHTASELSAWQVLWRSAWFALLRAFVGLQALAALELALCRLHAYIRLDGGAHVTVANVILFSELSLNVLRLAEVALDPLQSTGVLPVSASYLLGALVTPLCTVTSLLFFSYFEAATQSAGIAPGHISQMAHPRGVGGACAVAVLAVLGSFFGAMRVATGLLSLTLFLVVLPFVQHCVSTLLAARLLRRTRLHLGAVLPPPVLRRLLAILKLTMAGSVCLALGAAPAYLHFGPTRRALLAAWTATAHGVVSYAQIEAFRPVGVRVVRLPLRVAAEACARAAGRGRRRLSSVRTSGQSSPGPVPPSSSENASSQPSLFASSRPTPHSSQVTSHVPSSRGSRASTDTRASRRTRSSAGSRRGSGQSDAGASVRMRSPGLPSIYAESVATPRSTASSGLGALLSGQIRVTRPSRHSGRGPGGRGARGSRKSSLREGIEVRRLLGVSYAALRDFAAAHGVDADATSAAVGQHLRALTASSGLSYAEQSLGSTSSAGLPAVRRATLFVSHAQACSFVKLLDALEAHAARHELELAQMYCWIDVFSIRQMDVSADVRFIGEIVREIGTLVMVLDPWDAPVALTRAWCLYELMQCVRERRAGSGRRSAAGGAGGSATGGSFEGGGGGSGRLSSKLGQQRAAALHLTLAPAEASALVRALRRDREGVEAALVAFDARNAQASVEADRRMIFELIEREFAGSRDETQSGGAARVAAGALPFLAELLSVGGGGGARGGPRAPFGMKRARVAPDAGGSSEKAVEAFNVTVHSEVHRALAAFTWAFEQSQSNAAAGGGGGGAPTAQPSPLGRLRDRWAASSSNALRHSGPDSAAGAASGLVQQQQQMHSPPAIARNESAPSPSGAGAWSASGGFSWRRGAAHADARGAPASGSMRHLALPGELSPPNLAASAPSSPAEASRRRAREVGLLGMRKSSESDDGSERAVERLDQPPLPAPKRGGAPAADEAEAETASHRGAGAAHPGPPPGPAALREVRSTTASSASPEAAESVHSVLER